MDILFSPFKIAGLEFKNRIAVSPMCQYSSEEGMPSDWHLVHLGSRAVGGAALVMTEATAVCAEGRISPGDTGIWNNEQGAAWKKIVTFIHSQNAKVGIQLAHAGRKASATCGPVLAPSSLPFDKESPLPLAMTSENIEAVLSHFESAALRALNAGFDVIEIHAAHGYLLHEFLSPLSNFRKDIYGGSLENRMRLLLQISRRIKKLLPSGKALFVRISATDWCEGGWDLEQSIILCEKLREVGVDLVDVSSGGLVPQAKIKSAPLYQVEFSEKIRKWSKIPTAAVGLINSPQECESILNKNQADLIFLGRAMLRDPYWPLRAKAELKNFDLVPRQYERAWR